VCSMKGTALTHLRRRGTSLCVATVLAPLHPLGSTAGRWGTS